MLQEAARFGVRQVLLCLSGFGQSQSLVLTQKEILNKDTLKQRIHKKPQTFI